jgi:urease accessory protein
MNDHGQSRLETPRAKLPGVARIGIGGPVGSGKTALVERLIPAMAKRNIEVGVVANDIVTQEDAERIKRSGLIDPARVMAVETGACPHTAIREDPTMNIQAVENLVHAFPNLDAVLVESGGDNLASTFSLELVDYWLFVIDTAGGDDIPRKRGLGIVRSDLLIINKTDLASHVGVDLVRMIREANEVRGGRPVMLSNCKTGEGIEAVVERLIADVVFLGAGEETQRHGDAA